MNPFLTSIRNHKGERLDAGSAEARCHMVPTFGRRECEAALAMPDLQKTVTATVHKQLRFLDRSIGPQCMGTKAKVARSKLGETGEITVKKKTDHPAGGATKQYRQRQALERELRAAGRKVKLTTLSMTERTYGARTKAQP